MLITPYADDIQKYTNRDPRHVEAFMRVEFGTLDHLTPSRFRREVQIAVACIDECGEDMAEDVARSYGF